MAREDDLGLELHLPWAKPAATGVSDEPARADAPGESDRDVAQTTAFVVGVWGRIQAMTNTVDESIAALTVAVARLERRTDLILDALEELRTARDAPDSSAGADDEQWDLSIS